MTLTDALLSTITALMGICAWFLLRMVGQFDKLQKDVHRIEQAFVLFRQRVSMTLGIRDDNEEYDEILTDR